MNASHLITKRLAFVTDCVADIRLAEAGWITPEQRDLCRRMVSFRNIVVHRDLQVDPRIAQQIVEHHLDDLLGFVRHPIAPGLSRG